MPRRRDQSASPGGLVRPNPLSGEAEPCEAGNSRKAIETVDVVLRARLAPPSCSAHKDGAESFTTICRRFFRRMLRDTTSGAFHSRVGPTSPWELGDTPSARIALDNQSIEDVGADASILLGTAAWTVLRSVDPRANGTCRPNARPGLSASDRPLLRDGPRDARWDRTQRAFERNRGVAVWHGCRVDPLTAVQACDTGLADNK